MTANPTWELLPTSTCSTKMLSGCHTMLATHFDGVTYADFRRDLAEKEMVAVLHDGADVHGFSTMTTFAVDVFGEAKNIVFSGDTVVDPKCRNQFGLGKCMGEYFMQKLEQLAGLELWYVLISKGWGTYKVLPFTFNEFTPRPDFYDPEHVAVTRAFARYKYPNRPLVRDEVLVAPSDAQRLKNSSDDVIVPKSAYGVYFSTHNPNFLRGDELVCVARVTPSNFSRRFQRVLKERSCLQL